MGWYDTAWKYRVTITSQSAKVDAAVSNVYLDLASMPAGFWSHVQDGGGDIRITQADGETEVAREVVSCDTGAQTGEVHFDATGIQTGSDVDWYVYYGNAGASDYAEDHAYGRENVWDANHIMVQHLSEDPTSGVGKEAVDSTANDTDGDTNGSMTSGDLVDGQIGDGWDFDGSNDYVSLPVRSFSDEICIMAWANGDTNAAPMCIASMGSVAANAYMLTLYYDASKDIYWRIGTPGDDNYGVDVAVPTGSWSHIVGRYDGATQDIFLNGAKQGAGSAASGNLYGSSTYQSIGEYYTTHLNRFNGALDELRVLNVAPSDNEISTWYNNQSDPGAFWAVGDEEALPAFERPFRQAFEAAFSPAL